MDLNTPSGRQHALDAVQRTADEHKLPTRGQEVHDGTIHIYVDQYELSEWLHVTGGHVTTAHAASHVLRTLHTFTDAYGGWTGIPVQVHALLHVDAFVLPEIAAATLRTTAA